MLRFSPQIKQSKSIFLYQCSNTPDIKVDATHTIREQLYDQMSAYDDCTHKTNPTAKTPKVRFITDKVKPSPKPTYTVDIDFDEAATAWMANKVRRGPSVCYQCTAIKKDGHPCAKAILVQYAEDPFLCKTHKRWTA